jgi:hypothetical protein
MTANEKGASSPQKLEFPTINRTQALHQLELLGYKPEDKIYLRFFYPADDPGVQPTYVQNRTRCKVL